MTRDELLNAMLEHANRTSNQKERELLHSLIARIEEGNGSLAEGRRLLTALKGLGEQRRLL